MIDELNAYDGLWCKCGRQVDEDGCCSRCEPPATWADVNAFADRQEANASTATRSENA